jgi:hypothetical protein
MHHRHGLAICRQSVGEGLGGDQRRAQHALGQRDILGRRGIENEIARDRRKIEVVADDAVHRRRRPGRDRRGGDPRHRRKHRTGFAKPAAFIGESMQMRH